MIPDARTVLILGGARSGKSRRALRYAEQSPRRVFIATAQARDKEMEDRIRLHRQERDDTWSTIEAPIDIADAIRGITDPGAVIVVDCLTLWLSNLMAAERDPEQATRNLIEATDDTPVRVIFVSNEVGLGIVPENAVARTFRDAQGRLNQDIAAFADHVEFIAAGLPLTVKSCNEP